MNWLGLDIGGANLKASDGKGFIVSRPFPLWKHPERLAETLAALLAEAPPADALAVAMTGELADCFTTKSEGVAAILAAVDQAAPRRRVRVYLTDGRWASPQEALVQPLLAAASNWHALARYAGRFVPAAASLLVDVGSTTTDIIPLLDGRPAAQGATDPQRLIEGELVYTGVLRSPLCAVVDRLPWRGGSCPVAQEFFATVRDAYLLLGELPESPEDRDTADGRPATAAAAHDRLARSICADRTLVSRTEAEQMAAAVFDAHSRLVAAAIQQVASRLTSPPNTIILSGSGEFLARRALAQLDWFPSTRSRALRNRPPRSHALRGIARSDAPRPRNLSQASDLSNLPTVISLSDQLGSDASRAATAHALALLAAESNPL